MSQAARRGPHTRQLGVTAVPPFRSASALGLCLCAALLGAAITPAVCLDAAITDNNIRIFVAPLPSVLNTRTLSDYDVPRFFTQFGADPNGVWSNPIGMLPQAFTDLFRQSPPVVYSPTDPLGYRNHHGRCMRCLIHYHPLPTQIRSPACPVQPMTPCLNKRNALERNALNSNRISD